MGGDNQSCGFSFFLIFSFLERTLRILEVLFRSLDMELPHNSILGIFFFFAEK